MRWVIRGLAFAFAILMPWVLPALGEKPPASPGLSIAVAAFNVEVKILANPDAGEWMTLTPKIVSLNRTPRLFETEPASGLQIRDTQLRIARAGGKLLVRLSWHDDTHDAAAIDTAPGTPYEGRFHRVPTDSTDRFFDAAAVMLPKAGEGPGTPSLQMGDAHDPVTIYYWNAARGAMLMEAQGRETTKRTGATFPAKGRYENGEWAVVFELPIVPAGTPLAFAIWNGSQQDRDGRKYFSIWHWLE
jgi:hypothetical protein